MIFLGRKLRMLRESKKMSQEVLAEVSGLRQGEISAIERGDNENPNGAKVAALAQALGITNISYFYSEEEPPTAKALDIPPGHQQVIIKDDELPFVETVLKLKSEGISHDSFVKLLDIILEVTRKS